MSSLAQFEQSGFVVVKNLLSAQEVADYKAKLQQLSNLDDRVGDRSWACPNGVSKNPQFWSLIWHPDLLAKIREIFGNSIRYTQHSDLHVHRDAPGWHRDSADRIYGVGSDWDEGGDRYQVARVAIYLQSYSESGSSLVVIPGSHRYEEPLSPDEKKLWTLLQFPKRLQRFLPLKQSNFHPYLQSFIRTTPSKYFMQPPTQPISIQTEPGDCIIFDTRLIHSGSPIRGPKYAVFLSYGADNKHSRNHLRYYLNTRTDLGYENLNSELTERLKEENLLMEI